MEQTIYRAFSDYLKDRYGEKVYKLPIALPVTCPKEHDKTEKRLRTQKTMWQILAIGLGGWGALK